jgi:opacity protein-like surface antigen
MKCFKIGLFFFISLLLMTPSVYGEDAASTTDLAQHIQDPPAEDTDGWQFKFMPYAWLPTTLKANKATLSGVEGSMRLNLQDILDNLDMVFYGRLEAWKNDKWGFSYDTFYLNLGYDDGFSPDGFAGVNLDLDIRVWMNDFAAHYRLVDQRFGDRDQQRFIFEPYGGLRYTYLKEIADVDVDIPGLGSTGAEFGDSRDWVEPFVGGRISWDLNEKFSINFRGDAGGFGIGSASKLTYNIIPGCTYKLTENTTFDFSYRYLNMDYSNGSGSDELGLDVEAYGPVIGMTILF